MPAPTTDPISSVLQRTFGGLEQKKEGLIRGGNSASARSSFNVLDKKLQATAKVTPNGIQFDEPTQYSSGSGIRQQINGGSNGTNTSQKIIVLNPQLLPRSNENNGNERTNGTSLNDASKVTLPKPKIVFYELSHVKVGYMKARPAGAGMANVGNTCYLNSTLQALFHTPALFNFLANDCTQDHVKNCSSSSIAHGFLQSCTVCAMYHTLRDTLRMNVIRPNRIYEKLKVICKHMVQGRQEDAHEFLRYLIESLQRSYLNSVQGNSKNLDAASKETTPFNQIFGGYMRQDVTCMRCKYVSTTFQHFMDILVDIRQVTNIEEALQHFFRQEKLGHAGDEASMYKCEKCKIKVPAKKRCFLEKPPAVLCIQLKRFSLMGGKIGRPVQLSKFLNIAPFIYPRNGASSQESVQYKLVSMITHVGPTPNCGHYTAIGEAANGQFFQFDDASVRPIPINQVLNTASYVVFYEMQRSSWASMLDRNSGIPSARVPSMNNSRPSSAASSNGERFIGPPRPPTINRITSEATSIIKPRIIAANGVVNKLGVVSSAAKSMANAVADVAKTVVNSGISKSSIIEQSTVSSEKSAKGLVPYDDESSDESEIISNGKHLQGQQQHIKPQFIPRALTVKKLVEKSSSPPTPLKATKKNWTVTDLDHHNPSIHSDNSTGSTNGSWIVTNQTARPGSAMSDDSKTKWTVTPLQRAIEEESTSNSNSNNVNNFSSGTATPTSSTSTTSSSSSASEKKRKLSMCDSEQRSARKRPSIDENAETDMAEYDDELDRGRTKKVKRIEAPTRNHNHHRNDNHPGGGTNPFQAHQDRSNHHRNHNNSNNKSTNSSSTSPSYRHRSHNNGHWSDDRRSSRDHYRGNNRDHDYYNNRGSYYNGNNHRDNFGRRQSFSGSENREKTSYQQHQKSFNRSFSYNSNHHRDSFRSFKRRY